MQTAVVTLDPLDNNRKLIQLATEELSNGNIVALPTETVYGLAADAFNAEAVARIFEVKERPFFDPLIVHIHHGKHLSTVADVPEPFKRVVESLAKQFWPGPLTIILPKLDVIPDIVTSGLPTVAVRVPASPTMRAAIKALGRPLAAPSANLFGHISPTSAKAVLAELGGRIPLIMDAGACAEGLESTIVKPVLDEKGTVRLEVLRSGPITPDQLKKIAPLVKKPKKSPASQEPGASSQEVDSKAPQTSPQANPQESAQEVPQEAPGGLSSHYAPRKPFILCEEEDVERLALDPKLRYALLCFEGGEGSDLVKDHAWAKVVEMSPGSGRLAEAAVRLFALMRQLDEDETIDVIIAESVPEKGIGVAIMDRMRRASFGHKLPRA